MKPMKQLYRGSISWWFATMVPAHTSLTTLAEREFERKRRLLSISLLSSSILSFSYILSNFTSFMYRLPGFSISMFCLLCMFWLNRRGYLTLTTLLFFFGCDVVLIAAAQTASLTDPYMLLWACFSLAPLLALMGLFVPFWVNVLLAVFEHILLLWYLLVPCYNQISHLLSPTSFNGFIYYLSIAIYSCAFTGAFFAGTTKNALIQADRAVELDLAHHALSEAYHNLENAHAMIQQQALTDVLTGLPNHRAVMEDLTRELEQARHADCALSLLFFDVDHFKHVNDTYGHVAGDIVLHQIGERARSILRVGEMLGRFGGEEFVVLLPDTNAQQARIVAERLRAAVAASPVLFLATEEELAVTVSIGIATYPAHAASEQKLLQAADEAMYIAKQLGRNQFRSIDEPAVQTLLTKKAHEGMKEEAFL